MTINNKIDYSPCRMKGDGKNLRSKILERIWQLEQELLVPSDILDEIKNDLRYKAFK